MDHVSKIKWQASNLAISTQVGYSYVSALLTLSILTLAMHGTQI